MKKYIISCLVLVATLLNFSFSFAGNSTKENKRIADEYVINLIKKNLLDGYSYADILTTLRKLKIEIKRLNTVGNEEQETRIGNIALIASINRSIKKIQELKNNTVSSTSKELLAVKRDRIRIESLKDIGTALGTYYSDREKYPDNIPSGCVNIKESSYIYMPGGIPTDPIKGRLTPGCDGTDGMTFAYRTGKTSDGKPYFVLGVEFESGNLGNSAEKIDAITNPNQLVRGSGKYYYLMN